MNSNLKVLLISPPIGANVRGGVSVYAKDIVDNVSNDRISIDHHFYFSDFTKFFNSSFGNLLVVKSISIFFQILIYAFKLIYRNYDFVHVNSGIASTQSLIRDGFYSIITSNVNCRCILSIHGWKERDFQNICQSKWRLSFLSKVLKLQSLIFVSSEEQKLKLLDLGINLENIKITSTMVDTKKYKSNDTKFNSQTKNVLFCSSLIKTKGVYELLNSIREVTIKHSNVKFIIMGDGKELKNLMHLSERLQIHKNVFFTGHVKGKMKSYIFSMSHVFVLPSYTEGFPNVILEALASKMAVIATPVGGINDFFVDGKNGFFLDSVPPKSADISAKLDIILSNDYNLVNMAMNNRQLALDKYDCNVVGMAVSRAYEMVNS